MLEITKILNNKNISLVDLFKCLELVKSNGDVVVIKIDGERNIDQYTVFISFPNKDLAMIRGDSDDLKMTILTVLKKYVHLHKNKI